jgi:hypothetical protein
MLVLKKETQHNLLTLAGRVINVVVGRFISAFYKGGLRKIMQTHGLDR